MVWAEFSGIGSHSRRGFRQRKEKSWRGARNIDWIGFEFASSVRDGARAWNQRTQVWLETCVYHRTGGSLLATYFVSAFWHGFYPAYYLFFLSVPLATSVNRLAFKRIRPLFMEADGKTPKGSKWLYEVFSWLCTTLIMNYLATAFQVRPLCVWVAMLHLFNQLSSYPFLVFSLSTSGLVP